MSVLFSIYQQMIAPIREIGAMYLNRRFRTGAAKMLVVCGHMRSGSSLLVHILNTNPAVLGYGETHTSYREREDFGHAAFDIYRAFRRLPRSETFVMDKVLHTRLLRDPDLLRDAQTLFLLREPRTSLSSILDLQIPITDTPEKAASYYTERLRWIRTAAQRLPPSSWTYLTYAGLTTDTETVFDRIETQLELESPLTTAYDTMWSTGEPEIGDSSGKIDAGRIVSQDDRPVNDAVRPFVDEAQRAFDQCLDALEKNA